MIRIAAPFGLEYLLLSGVETEEDEENASGDPGGGRDTFFTPLGDVLLCLLVLFGSVGESVSSLPAPSAALCFPVARAINDGDAFGTLATAFPFDLLGVVPCPDAVP